jgi:trehalose synthase-fused probable maltokinase
MGPSDQLDATWLASRRWFRSKARPLRSVTVHDQATLPDGGMLLILDAAFADGGHERYTVPAWPDGDGYREPADGDGLWRGLVAVMADGGRQLEAQRGSFDLAPGPALEGLLPGGRAAAEALAEGSLGVEQSNTSIRLGDRLMLKIYRLLEPGINPELEVTEFLTAAGFGHAPLAAGAAHYQPHDGDGEPAAVAIVQSQVPARGDAWGWMLERLGAPPTGPIEGLAAAAEIGGVTAELHDALQSEPDRPDFPSRAATAEELAAWQAGAEEQLDAAIVALDGDDRGRLAALAPDARRVLGAIGKAPMAWVSRIHGDYHLGQLLATDERFMVTDFEGEPARPLAERRRPSSPLRDVAGMLRSLDYAARSAERARSDFEPDPWLSDARAALLNAYGGSADPSLLAAFELEKACYEIRYEANFRPDWVPLPLGAVERLVA